MTEPDVLDTIRRAYRYVVAYERRVLDSISAVDQALLERGFDGERKREPLYTSFPSRRHSLEHWAWDNVPTYACRYSWCSGQPNTEGNRWVLVDHVADSAFEAEIVASGSSPDPLAGIDAPSQSILRWAIVSFADALPSGLYNRTWRDLLTRHFGDGKADPCLTGLLGVPQRREKPPLSLVTHCIDIASLTDASALRERFLDPLLEELARP